MRILNGCKVAKLLEAGWAELDTFDEQANTPDTSVNVPLEPSTQKRIPALHSCAGARQVHHDEPLLVLGELLRLALKKRVRAVVGEPVNCNHEMRPVCLSQRHETSGEADAQRPFDCLLHSSASQGYLAAIIARAVLSATRSAFRLERWDGRFRNAAS